jgi:nucleoside-diphosphate-sugar epimerase
MTKISVLGCGWLGLPLAKELIASDYKVNGSSTKIEKEKNIIDNDISSFNIDIENLTNNIEDFLNVNVLIITIPPRLKNHKVKLSQLVSKIENSTIKRVIYTSSISVYGNKSGIITEETPTNPTTETSIQVLETEQLLSNNKKFSTCILRLGGLIGENRHPAYHLSGKEIKYPNDLVNLVDIDDCIFAIKKLLKSDVSNEIFNLVNPNHPEKGIYYKKCCENLKLPLPMETKARSSVIKEVSSNKIINKMRFQFKNNLAYPY